MPLERGVLPSLDCTGSCNPGTEGLNQQSEYVGCSRAHALRAIL